MNTEAAFQAALDAAPDDNTLRLVFADWLDEQEPPDPRAAGYRAMGTLGLRPYPEGKGNWCGWFSKRREWHPFLVRHVLPDEWFDAVQLRGKDDFYAPFHDFRMDCPRQELEDAVALAYSHLSPEAQDKIMGSVLEASSGH